MIGSTFPGRLGAGANPFGNKDTAVNDKGISGVIHKVMEEDENDYIASPTSPNFGLSPGNSDFESPFGGDGPRDGAGPPSSFREVDGFPSNYGMGRRTSVSAESLNPTAASNDNWTPPFHKKTPEQLERLKTAIFDNLLFKKLDEEQSSQVLGALVEKAIPAKGIKVITQGDQGDFFYIVEKGVFHVHKNPDGFKPGLDGMGEKVATIEPGGSFGELALMYNAPRAATVISAETGCTLWALDRVTFRRILMDSTYERRRMYEKFLSEVLILSTLSDYERSKIADALEAQKFPSGSVIIKEGDIGEAFYLLESGVAEAYKQGTEKPVKVYNKGGYFGELALLNDAPRAASVIAKTGVKVATLGKDGFQRLLGPVEGIMRRTTYDAGVEDVDPLSKQ